MKKVAGGQLGYTFEPPVEDEFGILIKQFNNMSVDLRDLFDQKAAIEKENQRMEMQVLRAQINPHLIYNTLNNIKWMALINDEQNIAANITLLADFLEPVFRSKNMICSIEEELNYVKNYIAIMNMRGMEGYSLETFIDGKYYDCQILKFLLQPVVENCIMHGFAQRNFGRIEISMKSEGTYLFIRISDDGSGIEAEKLTSLCRMLENMEFSHDTGIGIINVNKRIKNWYGEDCGLTIGNRKETGCVVTMKIRLEHAKP